MSLVQVSNLSVAFGAGRVADGVSFTLDYGKTLRDAFDPRRSPV